VLNVIEFIDAVEQKMNLSEPQNVWPTVPISFIVMGETVSRRAQRLLNDNRPTLASVWQSSKVDNDVKLAKWKEWEAVIGAWVHSVYPGAVWHWSPFHTGFVNSL
jgi:hypothetical protein